jgi:hypothetical protein
MSLVDKIKSMFSGGSSADADDHSGHDHSGHDHSHDDEHGHDHPHDPVPAPNPVADDESTPA